MKEPFTIFYGGKITDGGGSGPTRVACDHVGENSYILSEINRGGNIATIAGDPLPIFQELYVQDLGPSGVQVLRGPNDNPIVRKGESHDFAVGSLSVTIEGTDSKGIIFNGKAPKQITEELERTRYKRPK